MRNALRLGGRGVNTGHCRNLFGRPKLGLGTAQLPETNLSMTAAKR
jgi:hypothetical protein